MEAREWCGRLDGDGQRLVDVNPELIEVTLGAAIEVHRQLGPGLLESVYESALTIELTDRRLRVDRQCEVPVLDRRGRLGLGFRADVIVEDSLLLELMAVEKILPIHVAQTLTYLKLIGFKRGFILNFNAIPLHRGINRVSI